MKKILGILFIINSFLAAAQESERLNYTDAKGMKQGHWIVRSDSGRLKYDGFFKDGKPIGIMKRYDEWGILKAELRYEPSGDKAYAKLFYEGGILGAEGIYKNQKKDSTWKYYSFHSKLLVAQEQYVNGQRHGLQKVFYSNGRVSEDLEYENGRKSGAWKQYFDDGTLKLDASYLDDKKTGPYHYYFADGKSESAGFYKNDRMHGWWIYYNEDGTVKRKIEYIDGLPKDPSELEKYEQEFFKKIEDAKGKIPELEESDLIPQPEMQYRPK